MRRVLALEVAFDGDVFDQLAEPPPSGLTMQAFRDESNISRGWVRLNDAAGALFFLGGDSRTGYVGASLGIGASGDEHVEGRLPLASKRKLTCREGKELREYVPLESRDIAPGVQIAAGESVEGSLNALPFVVGNVVSYVYFEEGTCWFPCPEGSDQDSFYSRSFVGRLTQ